MKVLVRFLVSLLGPWGFSASGWAVAALVHLVARAVFGGEPQLVFLGATLCTVIAGLGLYFLVRSFAYAEELEEQGVIGKESYGALQSSYLLPRLIPLALPIFLLGYLDHPLWWVLLGLPWTFLVAGGTAQLLSDEQWSVYVFLPLVLLVGGLFLWGLWWLLGLFLSPETQPLGWAMAAFTALCAGLGVWMLRRRRRRP